MSEPSVPVALGDPSLTEPAPPTNQATAGRAKAILCDASTTFREPTATERSALAAAFAGRNFVVYGKAFDLVQAEAELDLSDVRAVDHAIDMRSIALVEVKSTSAERDEHFRGH